MCNKILYSLLFLAMFLVTGAMAGNDMPKFESDTVVTITEIGADEDSHSFVCSDFKLTKAEVVRFFKKAVVITPREQHDFYDYLPCYVRGNLTNKSLLWRWDIRAGGTARLTLPSGEIVLLADEDKKSIEK